MSRPRIAIMGSGEGSTAEVCARSAADGSLRADIGLVISNQPASGIIRRAESWEHVYGLAVDSIVIDQHTHPDGAHARGQTDSESLAIAESLVKHDIDLVLMMGYLRIVGKLLLERYGFVAGRHSDVRQSRMLNWHPGPLPLTSSEYGVGAAEKVLDAYMAGKIVKSACVSCMQFPNQSTKAQFGGCMRFRCTSTTHPRVCLGVHKKLKNSI